MHGRLPGSLGHRVPLPQNEVAPLSALTLVPQNTLDLILQDTFHQLWRWWLHLPYEFLGPQVPFQVTDMEGGVNLPSLGKIQPICHRRHDLCNSRRSNPTTTKLDGQMGIQIPQMPRPQHHLIAFLKYLLSARLRNQLMRACAGAQWARYVPQEQNYRLEASVNVHPWDTPQGVGIKNPLSPQSEKRQKMATKG